MKMIYNLPKMKKILVIMTMFSPLVFGAFSCELTESCIAGLRASRMDQYWNEKRIFNPKDVKLVASIVDQLLVEYGFKPEAERAKNWFTRNTVERKYTFHDPNKNQDVICRVSIDLKSAQLAFTSSKNVELANSDEIRNLNQKIYARLRREYEYLPIATYPH